MNVFTNKLVSYLLPVPFYFMINIMVNLQEKYDNNWTEKVHIFPKKI